MSIIKKTTAKMSKMVCAACILGVGIGIGGIFLYRVLRRWLQQTCDPESIEHPCNNRDVEENTRAHCSAETVEKTSSNSASTLVVCPTCDDAFPNSSIQRTENVLDGRAGTLRHRSRSSNNCRSGSFSDGEARHRLSLYDIKSASAKCDTVYLESTGDTCGLSSRCQGCCLEGSKQATKISPHAEKTFHSGCHAAGLFPDAEHYSPLGASFHHSTPEDRDSVVTSQMIGSSESESMYFSKDDCPCEDMDTSMVVRNTLSWHDSVNVEPSPTQSSISLDDSLFLRDLNVEGSSEAEVLATCTAVSNLEQLEQEVAGVMSDCGDMERCFGVLRRRDSIKAVVGRYSLGVADSVLVADKCSHWQESFNSPIVDELSLSSSVGVGRHSGFVWDDDGFNMDSPSTGFVSYSRRATRSLSPLPSVRHQQANYRASLGTCADSQPTGTVVSWTGIENNTSTDLAPCSVYDVNRRLSGRLQVQHINS